MGYNLKIKVFAVLKDYLSDELTISHPVDSILTLRSELVSINPSVESLLKNCRFAINNSFVDNDCALMDNQIIYVIPPSSGG